MNLLLHTIALEPARWLPQRVSRPLAGLLPRIAAAGFAHLEIYEPHLTRDRDEDALVGRLAAHGLAPVVLSSYLDLSPADNPDASFHAQAEELIARIDRFGFRKVRLFPGRNPDPARSLEILAGVAERVRGLAEARGDVEFLLETHDGSLADDPAAMIRLVETCARPNVGLLWQPTVFEPVAARMQFERQKVLIRHFHLQNRRADGGFVTLDRGIIPWAEFLAETGFRTDATLEFVPTGICTPERFDLEASLREAAEEFARLVRLASASEKGPPPLHPAKIKVV